MKFRSLTPIVLTGFVSLTISLASSSAVMSEEKNCAADADKELSSAYRILRDDLC